ncbi:related to diploid state maintenance protein chpA [Melanopsichium pennsylvanicum]|uniref:Related to diploid state maintenance protein chpA n=2 Tax=Melanopsichium pennsylvanicum TaxID=63383 RepID=A0AAJ4XK94_9BASI|nr:related to diploid state maintenance protein chpA [Melanopsichium pennsylvanicum 4]SNX83884.1 related to diploid state maintenance protein chpA [Melanopsichium pennsylvanicum]
MVICTRRGCGVDFNPLSPAASCSYHPGAPVFHEGLKSWSCCNHINKPVMEFDQFLAISGCSSVDAHSTEKQAVPTAKNGAVVPEGDAPSAADHFQVVSQDADGKETFGKISSTADIVQPLSGMSLLAAQNAASSTNADDNAQAKKEPAEEEDPAESDANLQPDLVCKRGGCGFKFPGGARDRSNETCNHHKGSPIFHEGSKGWSCCKRRVLDFNDFLQIEPCTTAKSGHLFVGALKPTADGSADGEQSVDCRMDHYETPNDVRLTVYAKAVVADKSSIDFKNDSVIFSLWLPPAPGSSSGRRFQKVLKPFASIVPAESSFNITKFKVDLVLTKQAKGQSWPCLESGDTPIGYGLTFGRDKDK